MLRFQEIHVEPVVQPVRHHDLCYRPVPLTKRQLGSEFEIIVMSNHLSGKGNNLFRPVHTPRQLRDTDLHSRDTE